MTKDKSVLSPEGAQKLMEGMALTDDERALLLALVSVGAETGQKLEAEEQVAVDKLKAQIECYDIEELTEAVEHLVTAKTQKGREVEWPELKKVLRERRGSEGEK